MSPGLRSGRAGRAGNAEWRLFRPAIWTAMLGIALLLLVNPPAIGALVLGAAIGLAIRIQTQRRRVAQGAAPRRSRRR
ncbi:MAG: hypothetical protein WAL63_20940 [Solirubrobacteraceae bacterium]